MPKADAAAPSKPSAPSSASASASGPEPPKSQPTDSAHAATTEPVRAAAGDPVLHVRTKETFDLYQHGQAEAKRKNWANAIEAFGAAVKADPQHPDAWRELGRAHMYAHQYRDAEAAFRKYRELAPDDRLAYLNMAWALQTGKKYELVEDMLVKRIAVAPQDGMLSTSWAPLIWRCICPSKRCRCWNDLHCCSGSMRQPVSRWAERTWKPTRMTSQ